MVTTSRIDAQRQRRGVVLRILARQISPNTDQINSIISAKTATDVVLLEQKATLRTASLSNGSFSFRYEETLAFASGTTINLRKTLIHQSSTSCPPFWFPGSALPLYRSILLRLTRSYRSLPAHLSHKQNHEETSTSMHTSHVIIRSTPPVIGRSWDSPSGYCHDSRRA